MNGHTDAAGTTVAALGPPSKNMRAGKIPTLLMAAGLAGVIAVGLLMVGYRNVEFVLRLAVEGVVLDGEGKGLGRVSVYFVDLDLHQISGESRPEMLEMLLGVSDEGGRIGELFHYIYGHSSFLGISTKHETFALRFERTGCTARVLEFKLSELEKTTQGYRLSFRTTVDCEEPNPTAAGSTRVPPRLFCPP
jgi:hypothetical protein